MSDADSARSAKAVAEIAHHLKELVKVNIALNENLVTIAKDIKQFIASFEIDNIVDAGQQTLNLVDTQVESVLGQDESRRQRPDRFEDKEPHAP